MNLFDLLGIDTKDPGPKVTLHIGTLPIINYIAAAQMIMCVADESGTNPHGHKHCVIIARGHRIKRARDIVDIILKKNENVELKDEQLYEDKLINADGNPFSIDVIELEIGVKRGIHPPKKKEGIHPDDYCV